MKLVFLHGGPGYPDYLEQFFSSQFSDEIETVFYTQQQGKNTKMEDLLAEVGSKIGTGDLGDLSPDELDSHEPVILVGHSWGGALAIDYMRKTDDPRVRGLVLIGAFLSNADLTAEFKKELARLKLRDPSPSEIFLTDEEVAESGDLMEHLEREFNTKFYDRISSEFILKFDAVNFMKKSKTPVLNIFGENAIRVPARRIRTYSEINPNIKNFEVRGAGHFPFIREKDQKLVVAAIESFINEIK